MKYSELKDTFRDLKRTSPTTDLTAHIVFSEDSYTKPYSLLSRTYCFSSDNRAFQPNMSGYSIFASCLDRSDQGVRLDWYMREEGNEDGWITEDCYILEHMRDAAAIPNHTRMEQDDGTVCYFFGDTCISVCEIKDNGKINLIPVSGDQVACGEWTELSIDRIYGYCTLLNRHLNK